jgi:hypothetical protein
LGSQFQSVNVSQFWELLDREVTGVQSRTAPETAVVVREITLEDIMSTWTGQEGYPLVHCKRTDDKTTIVLTQVISRLS